MRTTPADPLSTAPFDHLKDAADNDVPPSKPLSTDSTDVFDAIRSRLTPRQNEIFYYKYVGEKLNSTIASILRVSLSTVEKELQVIRAIRSEICGEAIEAKADLRTDIPMARGHLVGFGRNGTLRAVITGTDRRRIPA
jgi:DNA-directed RNA polymerase specialized sigma24 family protein